MCHCPLGHDHPFLREPARAFEHLQKGRQIFNVDVWFRRRYNIRSQAEPEAKMKNRDAADEPRGRARSVIQTLAESVADDNLRRGFLKAKSVRELEG